jgi:hypothetical protein
VSDKTSGSVAPWNYLLFTKRGVGLQYVSDECMGAITSQIYLLLKKPSIIMLFN